MVSEVKISKSTAIHYFKECLWRKIDIDMPFFFLWCPLTMHEDNDSQQGSWREKLPERLLEIHSSGKVDQDVDSLFSPLSFKQAPTLSRGVRPFEEASHGLEKGCTFS